MGGGERGAGKGLGLVVVVVVVDTVINMSTCFCRWWSACMVRM